MKADESHSDNTGQIIGIKFNVGPGLCEISGMPYEEFLKQCTCVLIGIDLNQPFNSLECKFYDEDTGDIYYHFKRPLKDNNLASFFPEEELIRELPTVPKNKSPRKRIIVPRHTTTPVCGIYNNQCILDLGIRNN